MSFIKVRDQHGNPPPAQDRLFLQLIPDGGDGTSKWDEFTDNAGNRSFPPDSMTQWPAPGYTIAVNEANVNTKYGTARVHVVDLEAAPVDITVELKGAGSGGGYHLTTITDPSGLISIGTVAEWKALAHTASTGLGVMEPLDGPQPNLKLFETRLKNVDSRCELQNSERGESHLKPRFFPPILNATTEEQKYARPIDFGDFNMPFFHNDPALRHEPPRTDVWDPTGRPPSSEW